MKIDPKETSAYVLLANTYAAAGKWKEQERIFNEMATKNIKKIPASTIGTINGKTEVFYVDSHHPYPQS